MISTSMTYRELSTYIKDNGPVEVMFNKGVEDLESYPEAGMRGTIVNIRDDGHPSDTDNPEEVVLKLYVKYDGHEVFNSLLESANYYDLMRVPRQRAAASGDYKKEETIYVMATDPVGTHMDTLRPAPAPIDPARVAAALQALNLD